MNSTQTAKFNIPQLDTSLIFRSAVMRLLDQGMRRRLTLVAAPAGYGKTTSVAMWLHAVNTRRAEAVAGSSEKVQAVWYSLDAGDNDFSTFSTGFVGAIQFVMPAELRTVAVGLAAQNVPPLRYVETLLEACLQLPQSVIMVLDDYHMITSPDIHALLDRMVEYASSKLHLVMITRHDPPLPIARWRARQQLVEVRADDLRLNDDEAAQLLQVRLERAPSSELLAILQNRTEGWVAGLQLAASSLRQEKQSEFLANLRRSENSDVSDFLVDEVLDHVGAEMRTFLLKTSLIARFSVPLAAVMTGLEAAVSGQVIEQLRRMNLFLVRLEGEPHWYRYHHQFRAMLMNRAGLTYSVEAIADIRRAAADWLITHDWLDEALDLFAADHRWDQAADLVEADRHRLQNQQNWNLLWRRLRLLPDDVVAQRPGLLLADAWILQVYGRYGAMLALADRAAKLLSGTTPVVSITPVQALWGEISALRGAWMFTQAPLEQRLATIQEALALLSPPQHYGWVRGFAFISLVHVLLGQGERDTARAQVTQELETAGVENGLYRARLYHALATLDFLDGSLGDLIQIAVQYAQLAFRYNLTMAGAWAQFAMGWALYQQGETLSAYEALRPIFDRQQEIHLQNLTMALTPLVPLAADLGRSAEAARLLDDVRRIALERENAVVLGEVLALTAYAALLSGDHAPALTWAAEFTRAQSSEPQVSNTLYTVSAATYIYAKIALAVEAETQVRTAIQPLLKAAGTFQGCGYQMELLQAAVLLACCYWRTGQPVKAIHWMQQAVEIGWPRGFRRVYFEQGADVAPMLYAMVQRGICAEASSKLLAEYGAWSSTRQAAQVRARPVLENGVTALTDREEEVLVLLAQKLSNKEIAKRLHLSVNTVRNHTSHIYEKFNVTSRRQAIALAQSLHLIP